MLIDARTIPNRYTIKTDICIIGAGAAGITLAREFIGWPFRVCLLESGGFESDADTQVLNDGTNVGLPYYPLIAARLRYFGGTTNHWGGYCRSFHDLDFEVREWVPYSGWPFPRSTLEPFYKRARPICQVGSSNEDTTFWQELDKYPALPLIGNRMITRVVQIIHPRTLRRFGTIYRNEVTRAENVTTYLHANVTELETDEAAGSVVRVHVACLPGNAFWVEARLFILALGGIENPRLLLLSNKSQPAGLGNQHDLVGRFFMEHPRFVAGVFLPSDPRLSTRFYKEHRVKNFSVKGGLSLSEDAQRSEKLMDVWVRPQPVYDQSAVKSSASKGIDSLKTVAKQLREGNMPSDLGKHVGNIMHDIDGIASSAYSWTRFRGAYPIDHIKLITRVEQAPNPDSRVTLAAERDRLGLNRVQLNWRLSPIDTYSARRTLEILGAELGRAGLGRLKITLHDDDTAWPADTRGGFHHMGTTRMSNDPKQGVVDHNCKVHGISNLFIAGSSVFPTGGSGTPTYLLVALALRLADHLKERMQWV